MSKSPEQNFTNAHVDPEVAVSFTAQSDFSYQEPAYSFDGAPVVKEDLSLNMEALTREELELLAETLEVSRMAEGEGAPISARAVSVATAFAGAPLLDTAETPDAISQNEVGVAPSIAKHTKAFLAGLSVMAGLGGALPATAGPLEDAVASGVAIHNKVESLKAIDAQIKDLNVRIEKIEKEKGILVRQEEARQRVGSIEAGVSARVQPKTLDAQYKVEMAQINLQISQARERFLRIPSPTAVDENNYNAELARIDLRKVEIEGRNEVARARESARAEGGQIQLDVSAMNAEGSIANMSSQQEQLRVQIRGLQAQRANASVSAIGGILGMFKK